jgi:hypothetical protein
MVMAWHPAGLVCILEAADDPHDDDDDAPLLRLPLTSRRSCSPTQEIISSSSETELIKVCMKKNLYLLCVLRHGKRMWLAALQQGFFSPIICNSVLVTAIKHDSDDE